MSPNDYVSLPKDRINIPNDISNIQNKVKLPNDYHDLPNGINMVPIKFNKLPKVGGLILDKTSYCNDNWANKQQTETNQTTKKINQPI